LNYASTKGKIGRALTPDERMAIIEYLKALPSMPPEPHQKVPRD
jgi:hypothetical protein